MANDPPEEATAPGLPETTLVVVADAAEATVYCMTRYDLKLVSQDYLDRVEHTDEPLSAGLSSVESLGQKHHFDISDDAARVALITCLDAVARRNEVAALVLSAPEGMLHALLDALPDRLRKKLILAYDADLSGHASDTIRHRLESRLAKERHSEDTASDEGALG